MVVQPLLHDVGEHRFRHHLIARFIIFQPFANQRGGDIKPGRFSKVDFPRRLVVQLFNIAGEVLVQPVLMLFVLLHITNKYYCQTDMEQIRKLEAELEVSKTERVRAKSIYKSNTRESSMQARIDSMRLGLTVRTAPPFKLPAP